MGPGPRAAAIAFLIVSIAGSSFAARPADPSAHPDAGKILEYIATLHLRPEKRVLSGQFLGYGYQARAGYEREIVGLRNRSDKWVALVATDFAYSGDAYLDYCNALAEYWKAGHLVSLSYHAPDPGAALGAIPSNPDWKKTLDFMAVRLKHLQDRGVMVLWRPFHEMNGDWFWWGRKDPEEFKAAWRHMFDYFTKTKGLHNLLWVYAPDDSRDRSTAYYPGDAYVDIAGLDNYNFGASELDLDAYDAIAALGKPIGLTEFSPKTNQKTPDQADWRVLLEGGLKQRFTRITFFLAWDVEWSLLYNKNGDLVMRDPWIIDRESLAWREGGNTALNRRDVRTKRLPVVTPDFLRRGPAGPEGVPVLRWDGRLLAPLTR